MAKKLQKCGTEEEMRQVVGRICHNYLHGLWKVVAPAELKFKKITGGLSNFIYVIGLPDNVQPLLARVDEMHEEEAKAIRQNINTGDEPKQVLLRIYGQVHGERAMDAIVTESVIFTLLSERRLGPKLFGVFSGGRIEQYLPSRPLRTKELSEPTVSMKIAEKTAGIHSMDIPLSKEPNFLWKSMHKWLKTVEDEIFVNNLEGQTVSEQEAIDWLRKVNFEAEIQWLKKYLSQFDSPVVFCHNDLQEGNILLLEGQEPATPAEEDESVYATYMHADKSPPYLQSDEATLHDSSHSSDDFAATDLGEPKLHLIDFEYCAYNYRAFDIANHFAEWGYDYTNPERPYYHERREDWPTLEQKEIFIREYLKQSSLLTQPTSSPKLTSEDIDEVNKLLLEVEAFTLASHLFWSLWSVVNGGKSEITFGYWEYGRARLETYFQMKQEVIKKEQMGLPQKRKIEEVDI